MLVASGSLFWTLLKNLDMLGRTRATVLDFVGEFGHFGSQEGHCFGPHWSIWTSRVARRSLFWALLASLDILVANGSLVWNLLESLDALGLRKVTVLEFIGGIRTFWVA